MKRRILVVDDDTAITTALAGLLGQASYHVATAASAEEGLGRMEHEPFDAVVTDLRMPGMSGTSLVGEIRRRWEDVPVVVVTAFGSVETAVEAMRAGAYDFLQKPFQREDLLYALEKAIVASEHSPTPLGEDGEVDLVCRSAPMQEVDGLVRRVARTEATVLILGETGVGKEVVARTIHRRSPRSGAPFVKVHCAALPETLLESELFGYERGAFTGATTRKPGRFEIADGGTLFLDEIGELSPATQVKLLRVLQDGEYERVGGTRTLIADVRIVTATHRDLGRMRAEGKFRDDLFYRLEVFPIRVPALRERRDDLPDLVQSLLVRAAQHAEGPVSLTPHALARLVAHDWPGNVRELANVLERLVILRGKGAIEEHDVAAQLGPGPAVPSGTGPELATARAQSEREAIERALAQAGGNRTRAARLLGIGRRTLYTKMAELGIDTSPH